MSEGVPKPHIPSEEERERARNAHESADPTAYSALPPETLVPTGEHTPMHSRLIVTDGEERYVPLPKGGPRQQVVSRLLKGIVNVADVVDGPDGKQHSKILKHESIEQPSTPDSILADVEVTYLVFGDFDRRYYSALEMETAEHSNMRIEAGRASYYDFQEAGLTSPPVALKSKEHTTSSLRMLDTKLEALKRHLSGADGLALINGIADASGKSLYSLFPYSDLNESPEHLQEGLLRRIDHARFLARQELTEKEREAA